MTNRHPANADNEASAGGVRAEPLVAMCAYAVCNTGFLVLGKSVIGSHKLNYPLMLVLAHNSLLWLSLVYARHRRYMYYPDFNKRVGFKWMPLAVLSSAISLATLLSLRATSISALILVKNWILIVLALGDKWSLRQPSSLVMLASIVLMVAGSIIGVNGDHYATSEGLFWSIALVVLTVIYVGYLKVVCRRQMSEIGMSGPLLYNSALSFPVLVPAAWQMGAFMRDVAQAPHGTKLALALFLASGCLAAHCDLWCRQVITPTKYGAVRALNKISVTVVAMIVFEQIPPFDGALGISLGLLGTVVHTFGPSMAAMLCSPQAPEPPSPKAASCNYFVTHSVSDADMHSTI